MPSEAMGYECWYVLGSVPAIAPAIKWPTGTLFCGMITIVWEMITWRAAKDDVVDLVAYFGWQGEEGGRHGRWMEKDGTLYAVLG